MRNGEQENQERAAEAAPVSPSPATALAEESSGSPGGAGGADSTVELKARVEKLEDALLRARADFQNLQRRAEAERIDAIRFANVELMKSLVKIVDDFERALAASDKAENVAAFMEGMRLVYANLTKALADHGLETIEAMDARFDPSIHEALLHQPTESRPAGTVVEQVAKGYRLRGRTVRPAKVIVAKALAPPPEEPKAEV